MQLTPIDFGVILLFFAINAAIALYYRRFASRGLDEFFVSGRSTPWWLAGTSMVATTFAVDTPLAVAGMIATGGIAGNWLWWNFVFSGMLTTVFFAHLWRRAGVLTDVEFAEIRYSGKPAAFLRGFRAVYLGVFVNCIVMGWVNLAMVKVLGLVLGVEKFDALLITVGLTMLTAGLSALSGLKGVLVTDFLQFIVMMITATALAVFAVGGVGGMGELKLQLGALEREGSALDFFPSAGSEWMPLITLAVYLSVNWWATWYPGAEPGGGGFIAQRMFATKDERHSLFATLWFNVAHYAVRPWPWILTGLCALVLYPGLADAESGYVQVMVDYLPPYMRGLMLAAMLAAFVSTISTLLNWGASYVVNDFYQRFVDKSASERKLVNVSRLVTAIVAALAATVTFYMDSIQVLWKLLIVTGAGTGLVLILRWFWWRMNAWSEVSAMLAAAVVSVTLQTAVGWDSADPTEFAYIILVTVGLTTLTWIVVTLATKPEPLEVRRAFYKRAQPYPALWGPIAAEFPEVTSTTSLLRDWVAWAASCIGVMGTLFGVGSFLLQNYTSAAAYLTAGILGAYITYWGLSPRWK